MATTIELYGFARDRKSRDVAQSIGNVNQSDNESVSIQQQFESSEGPTTNVAGGVKGDILSGEFHGPASSGGDALDMRGSTAPIVNPNGPVNIHIGDKIVEEHQKKPIPRIRPPRSDFVGRDAEMKEIIAKFERGATITGLRGMGGVGKTELALALAAKLKDNFPDGQIFLNMLGTSNSPLKPEDAMGHVIRSYLGVDASLPEELDSLSELYHSVLSDKKVLILLDNAASREHVEPLLPPENCALLVTSRQKFALPGLAEKDLDVLPLEDAKKLLQEIAPRIDDHAEKLAKLCGCLPIALRNAAYALKEKPNLSPEGYIERLGDAKMRLQLVDASFSTSYELLTPELQRLWSLLSVFPADFDLDGAAAVWEMEEMPAEDALGELVKWSLVDFLPDAQGEGGRYRLHDLARDFAGSCLDDAAREPARLRHARNYQKLLWLAQRSFLQGSDSMLKGLTLFDINWMNIQVGQKWASENKSKSDEIAKICISFAGAGSVLNLRLHPREYIEWLEVALVAACSMKDQNAEASHLVNFGSTYLNLSEYQKAIEYYARGLKISREIGNRKIQGDCLGGMGLAYSYLGETHKAIEYCKQWLKISREIGNHRAEEAALGNLGQAYSQLAEPDKEIKYLEQALIIARKIGDRQGEETALGNLGLSYSRLGDQNKAIEYEEKALAISREIGDIRGEGNQLGNLGLAYYHLGEIRKSIEYYEEGLKISHEIGNRRGEGSQLFNMSLSVEEIGQREKAVSLAQSALAIFEQIESPYAETVRQKLAEWGA